MVYTWFIPPIEYTVIICIAQTKKKHLAISSPTSAIRVDGSNSYGNSHLHLPSGCCNIAMENPVNKCRFPAGKIIVSHNQRLNPIKITILLVKPPFFTTIKPPFSYGFLMVSATVPTLPLRKPTHSQLHPSKGHWEAPAEVGSGAAPGSSTHDGSIHGAAILMVLHGSHQEIPPLC